MSKTAPVNLFAIGAERFPQGKELLEAMSYLHATFQVLWPALELTMRHIGETSMGMNHDGLPVHDDEMAFHHLAADQVEDTLKALLVKTKQLAALSQERMWNTITNRHSLGMVALGKTFTCGGDVIPKTPRDDTPEYQELIAWLKANGYAERIDPESVGFKNMQAVCDDLASKHQPRPPHVTTSPQKTVTVTKA